jgi:hypothetical protein
MSSGRSLERAWLSVWGRRESDVRALVALSTTAAVLAAAPSAVASDEVLASLPSGASVGNHMSAYGGHVVWSERVAPAGTC